MCVFSYLTEAETQEAHKIKAQLDHTLVYYEWLEQLTEAIESGEILNISQFQNSLLILKLKLTQTTTMMIMHDENNAIGPRNKR